ncbi:MAG: hypothetical protein JWO00_430 [Candidatus Parcubacteria bacterium]|nr:hypothetical protein [Candidatus Parcubacteria bacterium]
MNPAMNTELPKNERKLLSISIDRLIFQEGSAVRARMIEYAKEWGEIHIIVATDASFRETSIAPNVWVYPTRSRMKALYPLQAASLGRFIIRRRGITNITCQDPFLTAFAGTALQKQFKIPLEIQIHTDISSPNFGYTFPNKVRKALALSYIPKADTVRVVSEKTRKFLMETLNVPEAKITLRPIAVDVSAIRNAPVIADLRTKYPQFKKIVLMASRLTPEKNISRAVRAWPEIAAKVPGAGLVIVGTGPCERHLKRLASAAGRGSKDGAPSVVFESWADQTTLASYYKTADLFLVTSLFEGYGMTLVEALAAECPVVSTDVGVARETGARIIGWSEADLIHGVTEALGV